MSAPLSPNHSTVHPEAQNTQVVVGEKRQRTDERELQALPDSSAKKRKFLYKTREQVQDANPSIIDGLTADKEGVWRRQYCRVIQRAGMQLKIPQWGIWTALLLCHRFFAIKSMKKNDRFQIATACLFLASKLEESVRTLVVVIKEMEKQRYETKPSMLKKLEDATHMELLKDETLQAERAVLYTLGFDLNINHPYKHILSKLKELGLLEQNSPQKINQNVLQNAWNFVNDCHRTLMCLQHPPEEIAAAALYLANGMMNVEPTINHLPLPEGQDFFQFFKTNVDTMNLICGQMLEIYEVVKLPAEYMKNGSSTSPPSTQDAASSQAFPPETGMKTEQSTPENKPDQHQPQHHQQHQQQDPQQQQWYGEHSHGNGSSNGNMNGERVKAESHGTQ